MTGNVMKLAFAPLVAAAIACASGQAWAEGMNDQPTSTQGAFIEEYDNTLAPLNFVKFCMKNSSACDRNKDTDDHVLPPRERAMEVLREVNTLVNNTIAPTRKPTDPIYANWTIWPAAGDCNDYAVTKRHQLIEMGWPEETLRLAVVKVDGQGHLVLVARLSEGDVVLDNLSATVKPWNTLGYEWISMQSGSNPRFWVAIGDHGRRLRASRLASLSRDPL
jgi:predicted transglutaminase-like cysteine proteinase